MNPEAPPRRRAGCPGRGPGEGAGWEVPPQVAAYADPSVRGGTGKNGRLRAAFGLAGGGRTALVDVECEVPLAAQRAMYCDGPGGPAYLYVASVSGGLLQGDRCDVRIAAGRGAAAHVTTQGATRVYGMDADYAAQRVSVTAGEGSYLEIVPDQIIPYAGSRFCQSTDIEVREGAAVVCSEVVASGREAMGESFRYDVCCLRTAAFDGGGAPLLADAACLEPGRGGQSALGAMGGRTAVGTVYVLAPRKAVRPLYERAAALLEGCAGVSAGASRLRGDAGLLVRILGDGTGAVAGAAAGVVAAARAECRGLPFRGVRKS